MKIEKLETHDRLEHFKKQSFNIGECCQDLINQRPFGEHPFYMFCHARTDDDGVTKRLIWQPRLSRPKPQTNSMLFKGYPGSDIVKVIWMIPAREIWDQFTQGKITEDKTIADSINAFQFNREELERNEPDDLSDEQIDAIYKELSTHAKYKKLQDTLYAKRVISAGSSSFEKVPASSP